MMQDSCLCWYTLKSMFFLATHSKGMCLIRLWNYSLSEVKYLNTHLVNVTNIKLVEVFGFSFLQQERTSNTFVLWHTTNAVNFKHQRVKLLPSYSIVLNSYKTIPTITAS